MTDTDNMDELYRHLDHTRESPRQRAPRPPQDDQRAGYAGRRIAIQSSHGALSFM